MENLTNNNTSRFPVSAQALLELQLSDWQFFLDQTQKGEGSKPMEVNFAKRQIERLQKDLAGSSSTDTHVRSETHGDEPAFVVPEQFDGLSKREYFAGRAMTGILANPAYADQHPASTASSAVEHADALIQALNK